MEKGLEFDRRLYVARRVFEQSNDNTYVVSLSSRTIVYKGMFLVKELRKFFEDLQDPDYESAIAVVHSRFSTNTNPSWMRAHPNRLIVHNGEINTIRGNVDKMMAREETMESEFFKSEMHKVLPIINQEGSDSAMLDNALEFMMMSDINSINEAKNFLLYLCFCLRYANDSPELEEYAPQETYPMLHSYRKKVQEYMLEKYDLDLDAIASGKIPNN